jgi:hypothetical protein
LQALGLIFLYNIYIYIYIFKSNVVGKHGRKDTGDVGRAKITTRGAQKDIMMLKILMF